MSQTAGQKALAAWGTSLPEWVARLAAEVDATSLARAGERVGYGKSALSMVISKAYGAGTAKVQAAVEERLGVSGAAVECPILAEIPLDRCRTAQAAPFQPSVPLAGMLRAACRTCSNRRTDAPQGGAP